MFSFFIKKSKIHLDCFTPLNELPLLFPLVPAAERTPATWKNLPTTVVYGGPKRGTMKTCPGVGSVYRSGFIIPAWSDIYINTTNNEVKWFPQQYGENHNPKQWGTEYLKDHNHIKLVSPWKIREKTGVQFLFTNAFWWDDQFKPFVPNGIVEYKYQHTTSVNMLFPKNMFPKELTIPAGKELAHVIPLTDKEVVLKMHQVSEEDYAKFDSFFFGFNGQYFRRKKLLQSKGL